MIRFTFDADATKMIGTKTQLKVAGSNSPNTYCLAPQNKTRGKTVVVPLGTDDNGNRTAEIGNDLFKQVTGLEPVAGAMFLKDITLGRFLVYPEMKAPKEGKRDLFELGGYITVEVIEETIEETVEVEKPEYIRFNNEVKVFAGTELDTDKQTLPEEVELEQKPKKSKKKSK